MLAVGLALAGLWLVIGGAAAFRSALSVADWLALSAGLAFAGNNLLSRATPAVPMASKTVAVFLGGALVSGSDGELAGPGLARLVRWRLLGAVLLYGFVWLGLAMATWQYGVTHLETGRAGVILVTELLVAVLTVSWFGQESHVAPHVAGRRC